MGKGGSGKGKSQSKGRPRSNQNGIIPGPGEVSTEFVIPSHLAGKVIGRGGKNIQQLQYESGLRFLEVQQRGQESVAVMVGAEQCCVSVIQYLQGVIQADMMTQMTYPSPPQTTDVVIAETTDAPAPPQGKATKEKKVVAPSKSPVGEKKPPKAVEDTPESDKDSPSKADDEFTMTRTNSMSWSLSMVHSSLDKVRALPRKWQIAGGAVVGAGTVAPAAGVGGAVAGGVGGLLLAPLTLGLSVPAGVVMGAGAGFTGGAVTGAAAGAGVTAYLTTPREPELGPEDVTPSVKAS